MKNKNSGSLKSVPPPPDWLRHGTLVSGVTSALATYLFPKPLFHQICSEPRVPFLSRALSALRKGQFGNSYSAPSGAEPCLEIWSLFIWLPFVPPRVSGHARSTGTCATKNVFHENNRARDCFPALCLPHPAARKRTTPNHMLKNYGSTHVLPMRMGKPARHRLLFDLCALYFSYRAFAPGQPTTQTPTGREPCSRNNSATDEPTQFAVRDSHCHFNLCNFMKSRICDATKFVFMKIAMVENCLYGKMP